MDLDSPRHGVFAVAGLAMPRAGWFRNLSQWCTAGSIPVRFVKCLSVAELRSYLEDGSALSAALIDGSLPGLDRDLLHVAREASCPVVVVGFQKRADWVGLGAAGTLDASFDQDALMSALRSYAKVSAPLHPPRLAPAPDPGRPEGRLVAVCGPGGSGSSTVAIALAQGLGQTYAVLLADLARRAEQGMLHDVGEVAPGIAELTDAFRLGEPTRDAVRAMAFWIPQRNYHLLLGLRKPAGWTSLPPRAFHAALGGMRSAFDVVVADIDADLEGESQCGSMDVEERNLMSRSSVAQADAIFVVGQPGMKGIHALARTICEVAAAGAEPRRVIAVCNAAPRNPKLRSELNRTTAKLVEASLGQGASEIGSLLFLPRRDLEATMRDCTALPGALVDPLARAAAATFGRTSDAPSAMSGPRRVRAGHLGHRSSSPSLLAGREP